MAAETEPTRATRGERPPYGWAALAALAVFALYAITLAPTAQFWDSGEYIAVAHILGIPHPPGNPLFVVLAHVWELLLGFTGLSPAVRINLFSAALSALAHGAWFLVAHRILSAYSGDRTFRLLGAAAATVLSATAFTVWNQSTAAAHVYTGALLTIALVSRLAFRWRDRVDAGLDDGWADRLLIAIIYILALSIGNHLMGLLVAPAVVVLVLLVAPRTFTRWRLYLAGAGAVAVGLSVFLFLPIRAAVGPVINETDPSCASLLAALQSIYTAGQTGCEALSATLTRAQYPKPSIFEDPTNPGTSRGLRIIIAQLGNYLQYFDWQWARSVTATAFGGARSAFTAIFTTLGLYGAWTHYDRDRATFWFTAVLFATLSVALVGYLNFEYGYSYAADVSPDMREVRERDYFFIASFSLWGVWAGIGLAALWARLVDWLRSVRTPQPRVLAAPLLALAFVPLVLNWGWASRADQYAARDWAYNLLMSVEPYAVLFTTGDNTTFPLWYLQEVEGIRQDVTVVTTPYLNKAWYAKQIKRLTRPCPPGVSAEDRPTQIVCQRRFEGTFEGAVPSPPRQTILPLSDERIEARAAATSFPEDTLVLRAGRIETTIPPGTLLNPADKFMIAIIATTLGERPIYWVAPFAPHKLNLRRFMVRQGLTIKLHNGPVPTGPESGIYELPEDVPSHLGPYVDLPRTDTLLWHIYMHQGDFPAGDLRVHPATRRIPLFYAEAHRAAAAAHAKIGEERKAARHRARAEMWVELAMPG